MTNSTLQVASSQKRLDLFVCENTELTRSRVKKLVEDGKITLNGKPCKAGVSSVNFLPLMKFSVPRGVGMLLYRSMQFKYLR